MIGVSEASVKREEDCKAPNDANLTTPSLGRPDRRASGETASFNLPEPETRTLASIVSLISRQIPFTPLVPSRTMDACFES